MKWTLLLGVVAVALLVVAPMAMAADHAKGEKSKGHGGVYGEVTKVDTDAKAITLSVKGKEEGATAETKVIKYTDATKVQIMAKGAEGEKPTMKEGTIADVKAGVKVGVKLAEDGSAAAITVMPAGSHEGGKKKPKEKTE